MGIERLDNFLNYYVVDGILAVIFILLVVLFLLRNKKQVTSEMKLFPIIYSFLYRGQFGIKFLESFTKKFRELVKLYGYISIGVGFVGMIGALAMLIFVAFRLVFSPASKDVAPFLPFTSVPGLGYVSFVHWIIAIFVVVIIHEASHAIVCMAHGLKVKNTGFGLFGIVLPILPVAFIEPDDKELKKKSDVVQYSVTAAGPMSNFLILIPIILLMMFVIPPIENAISEPVGFSFDAINDTHHYPASMINLSNGQTFNYFQGTYYNNITAAYGQMSCLSTNQTVSFGYYNESTRNFTSFYLINTVNHPDYSGKGFMGINNLHTVYEVKPAYRWFAPIFSWFDGLLLILFVVNFGVGLINLFPAGFRGGFMLDGGWMFTLALENVLGDKKKAEKIAAYFLAFFIVLILFSFITYFTGNPFTILFS